MSFTKVLTALVATAAISLGSAHASLIFVAGIDFDVPGNIDGDPNTPNTVLTEPDHLSVVASGSKDYNVTTNGVTFDLDGTSTNGNANRLRGGAVRNFPMVTDFLQLFSSGGVPTLDVTISGLDADTEYTVEFFHYNAGAFQQVHDYYLGSVAQGNLIGSFQATGNPNDPDNAINPFIPGSELALTSNANGEILVGIQQGVDGERITLNGITVSVVPEPSALALIGLCGLAFAACRRK